VKRSLALISLFAVLAAARLSFGAVDEYEQAKKSKTAGTVSKEAEPEKKVPWRGSAIIYSNSLSALSLDQGAELSYNPYYAQSFSFRPRYYPLDELSLAARMDLEIELTTSDSTDHAREWIISDLSLDASYAPTWMVIPVAKIAINPSIRLTFPTSIVSRGRSMVMDLSGGVAFRRAFDLLKGRFLKNIGLSYGFRVSKAFHEYATGQLTGDVCSGLPRDANSPNDPACLSTGIRNRSWRFINSFGFKLAVMEKLSFSASMMLINDLLYTLSERYEDRDGAGSPIYVDGSHMNHRAAIWSIFDVTYEALDWLELSLGVSTFHPQLTPDSNIRAPFINRYTAFYLDVAVPVDRFVSQVQTWIGRGR
jgi:hypothetical protein